MMIQARTRPDIGEDAVDIVTVALLGWAISRTFELAPPALQRLLAPAGAPI